MRRDLNLADLIKQIANDGKSEFTTFVGSVIEVNETERSCDVDPIDTGEDGRVFGVRLQGSFNAEVGIFLKPAVGSFVVVTMLNKSTGIVSLTTELDEIKIDTESLIFNGGSNGGLININDLTAEIQKLNANFSTLVNVINTWIPVPSDGGAAFKALLSTWTTGIQSADLSNITDDKITH